MNCRIGHPATHELMWGSFGIPANTGVCAPGPSGWSSYSARTGNAQAAPKAPSVCLLVSSRGTNPHSWRKASQLHDSDLCPAATHLNACPKDPRGNLRQRACAGVKRGSPDWAKQRWRGQAQAQGRTAPGKGIRAQFPPPGAGEIRRQEVAGARELCSLQRTLGSLTRGAKERTATGVRRPGFFTALSPCVMLGKHFLFSVPLYPNEIIERDELSALSWFWRYK